MTYDQRKHELLRHLVYLSDHWRNVPDKEILYADKLQGRLDLLVFSVLCAIDGHSTAIRPFILAPRDDNPDAEVVNDLSGDLHVAWDTLQIERASRQ